MSRQRSAWTIATRSVMCPTCGAVPGSPCVTIDGGKPQAQHHTARMDWAGAEGLDAALRTYPHRSIERNARPVFDPERAS